MIKGTSNRKTLKESRASSILQGGHKQETVGSLLAHFPLDLGHDARMIRAFEPRAE